MMKITQLNALQMPTWQWLQMNAAELAVDAPLATPYRRESVCQNPQQARLEPLTVARPVPGLPGDMERMRGFAWDRHNWARTLTIPRGERIQEPILLEFPVDEECPVLLDFLHIHAEEGSRAEIIVSYHAAGNGSCFHGGFTSLQVDSGAEVRLIKAQMLGPKDTHLDTTAVRVAEDGQGDVLFAELGAAQAVSGCNVSLTGRESRGHLDSLYMGNRTKRQDFNYRMEIQGQAAQGEIVVRGALSGAARKVLKSTLDFVSGCAGAKGREQETVLTLSDRVQNLSAPLLLCGEENVEGEHATTTGKPDAAKLYYLMSRGFSEKDAKRLLVEASFTPVLAKIPSESLRADILARIQEVVADES